MIKVKNLTKCYGEFTAVKNISFDIERSHVYGLLGANGAGKSTTMNMLTGCLAPTEGSIVIGGHDLALAPGKAKALIGYLPEIPPLYTDMTPREYLTFIASARRVKRENIPSHVEEVMSRTKVSSVSDKLIQSLSKGYRQRVGIAQAIISDPEIIILDEPTAGLDPRQIIEIRELISELGKDHTVIISSHILTEIEEICDRIIIISSGELIACDTIENLHKKYVGPDILSVSVKASPKQAAEILKRVGRLGKISLSEENGDICEISIESPKDRDIREELFFAFSEAKRPIIAMTKKESSLEDLFLKATDSETAEYPDEEKNEDDSTSLPSIKDFLRASSASRKSARDDSDTDSDDDDDYKPLFGRK